VRRRRTDLPALEEATDHRSGTQAAAGAAHARAAFALSAKPAERGLLAKRRTR
jgi:hypothetical protein